MLSLPLSLLLLLVSSPSWAETTSCVAKGLLFITEIPLGWQTEFSSRSDGCLTLYSADTPQAKAPAVIKVKTIQHSHAQDLKLILKKNWRADSEPDLNNAKGLVFTLFKLYNPQQQLVEARAYLNTPPVDATKPSPVLSVRLLLTPTADGPLNEGLYKEFLNSIAQVPSVDIFSTLQKHAEANLEKPTGKNFNIKYLHSIGKNLSRAFKLCRKQKDAVSPVVFRVSEDGQITDWFPQSENAFNSCIRKEMLKAKGMKTPFAPFHIFVELDPYFKNVPG